MCTTYYNMLPINIILPDFSTDILELAERNWLRNKDLLPHVTCRNIYFKVLDWTKDLPPKQGYLCLFKCFTTLQLTEANLIFLFLAI